MKDPRINRKNAVLILNWCVEKLGKSRFHKKLPKLIIHNKATKESKKYCGWFDELKITINIILLNMDSMHEFINTIIHEFWHYKQNLIKGYKRIYSKPNWEENYEYLPFERSANNKAKKLTKHCYKELLDKLCY